MLIGCLAEQRLEARQALLHMPGKRPGAHVVEHIGMPIEALQQLVQGAVGADAVKKPVHCQQQAVVLAAGQRPGHGLRRTQVETDMQAGVESLIDHQFVGVDQGKVDLAIIYQAQQVDGFQAIRLIEHQLRVLILQLPQLVCQRAALEHGDALVVQVFDLTGLPVAPAVDHLRRHLQIRLGKLHLLNPVGVGSQAGSGNVRALVLYQLPIEVIQRRAAGHFQLQPEAVGKALAQLVLQAGIAMAAQIEGSRRVAGNHAQSSVLTQLLQAVGLLTGNQQYRTQQGKEGDG